jgi:hypothetical protein
MKFIKLSLALLLSLNIGVASANCFGTANSYNCFDSGSGNSYNVQKYGNSTSMQGYNAGTGSTWSQQSNTYGNSTFMNGTSSSGSSWNQTITHNAVYGTDSRGNSFYKPR